jgi:hypothetical protein
MPLELGYGNLMLTPEIQAGFLEDAPEVFLPIKGGWGRMGMTHIRLAEADEETLTGALRTAWRLRVEKSAKGRSPRRSGSTRSSSRSASLIRRPTCG